MLDARDGAWNEVHHDVELGFSYAVLVKVLCEITVQNSDDVLVVQFFHDLEFARLNFFVLDDSFDSDDLVSSFQSAHEDISKSPLSYLHFVCEIPSLNSC